MRQLFLIGLTLGIGLLACAKINQKDEEQASPDAPQTYICDKDQRESAMGCHTHWCWHFTQQDLEDLKTMNGVSWKPCYVITVKNHPSISDPDGLVNAGGVPWWWWERGSIGDLVLKRFAVHDYRLVNGANDTSYGDALRQKGNKYCYDVNWSGKYWGTYCMIPMKEASSFSYH